MKTQQELDAESKAFWENLPLNIQDKMKKGCENDLGKYRNDLKLVHRSIIKDIVLAAILLGVIGLCNGFIIIPDILFGALAGFILRQRGGGAFWGMMLFALSYVVSFFLKWKLGWAIDPWKQAYPFIIIFWAGGVGSAISIGRFYGEYIYQKSTD